MVNFVKGSDNIPTKEEVTQEMDVTEDKMVQNLKNKITANTEASNTTKQLRKNIYESEVFTNRSNQVKIVKPKSFENAKLIGEAIQDGKVIILDLSKLDTALATRILDFISGICFACSIEPEKVEAKIFMIDPNHKIKKMKDA